MAGGSLLRLLAKSSYTLHFNWISDHLESLIEKNHEIAEAFAEHFLLEKERDLALPLSYLLYSPH